VPGRGRSPGLVDAPTVRLILPITGWAVSLREPTGAEDVLLADCRGDDPALVLKLAEQMARAEDDVDWAALPVFDADTLIMRLRRLILGDALSSSLQCASEGCGSQVEISFGVESYLDHHRPRRAPFRKRGWSVGAPDETGWHALAVDDGTQAQFRLPTLRDQIAVAGAADPPAALAGRCMRPEELSPRLRSQAESAMAALAPPLAGPLHGHCPDCGGAITAWFEARAYCLREIGFRARFVYDDVDVLAERYHWSERAILTLPNARRMNYAERARQVRHA
jgi:hypothetical protein